MGKKIKWISALALIILVLAVTPATAAPVPLDVGILVITYISPSGNSGPFYAWGPAVDAGLICRQGTTIDIFNRGSGGQSNRGANYLVLKQFTCDDDSGSFLFKMEARVDFRGDLAPWNVFSGTGQYENLLGAGKDVGYFFEDDEGNVIGVYDLFSGKLH